jgi:hypothetical protein
MATNYLKLLRLERFEEPNVYELGRLRKLPDRGTVHTLRSA